MKNLHQTKYLYIPHRGVVTRGKPTISEILPSPKMPYSSDHLLHVAASAMAQSKHPLADAICNYAEELSVPYDIYSKTFYTPSLGVEAEVTGTNILVGSRRFMEEKLVRIDALREVVEDLSRSGKTVLFIAVENVIAGIIAFADSFKAEVEPLFKKLRGQGVSVVLVSDDHSLSAKTIAELAGIERIAAELTPREAREHMVRHGAEDRLVAAISQGGEFEESLSDADFIFDSLEVFVEQFGLARSRHFRRTNFTREELVYRFITFTIITLVLAVIFDAFIRTVPALSAGILASLAIQLGSYLVHNR